MRAPQDRSFDSRLWLAFLAFDRAHPEVGQRFIALTLDLIKRGYRRHSADAILHWVRWEYAKCKVGNDWTPFYARKFRDAHPEYEGFFQFRSSRADPPSGVPPRQGDLFAA